MIIGKAREEVGAGVPHRGAAVGEPQVYVWLMAEQPLGLACIPAVPSPSVHPINI